MQILTKCRQLSSKQRKRRSLNLKPSWLSIGKAKKGGIGLPFFVLFTSLLTPFVLSLINDFPNNLYPMRGHQGLCRSDNPRFNPPLIG